jgi:hypothetical protein
MIHLPAFTPEQYVYSLISITYPGLRQVPDSDPESSLLILSAAVLISGSHQLEYFTSPACADLVTYLQYLNLLSLLSRLQGFFRSTS